MLQVSQKFGRAEKLKSRKTIGELFNTGKSIHQFPYKVVYMCSAAENTGGPAKFAVSVSKRYFKKAVERNRIKRKIREAYRKNKHLLNDFIKQYNQNIILIVIYIAKENLDYHLLEQNMAQTILLLIKKAAGFQTSA